MELLEVQIKADSYIARCALKEQHYNIDQKECGNIDLRQSCNASPLPLPARPHWRLDITIYVNFISLCQHIRLLQREVRKEVNIFNFRTPGEY